MMFERFGMMVPVRRITTVTGSLFPRDAEAHGRIVADDRVVDLWDCAPEVARDMKGADPLYEHGPEGTFTITVEFCQKG